MAMVTTAMAQQNAPVKKADKPTTAPQYGPDNPRQVRIRAKLIEWTHGNQLDLGFSVLYLSGTGNSEILRTADITLPQQSPLAQGVNIFLDNMDTPDGDGGFEAVIQALEQDGEVKVLSEPNIVVPLSKDLGLDKQAPAKMKRAQVKTSSKVPYESAQPAGNVLAQVTKFKDTAITLDVAAVDIYKDYVTINMESSVTILSGFISVALNTAGDPLLVPQTNTRRINSTVLVRDHGVFITGLMKSNSQFSNEQGVPWISKIPILGWFFKNKQKRCQTTELLFILQPEILEDTEAVKA